MYRLCIMEIDLHRICIASNLFSISPSKLVPIRKAKLTIDVAFERVSNGLWLACAIEVGLKPLIFDLYSIKSEKPERDFWATWTGGLQFVRTNSLRSDVLSAEDSGWCSIVPPPHGELLSGIVGIKGKQQRGNHAFKSKSSTF